MEAISDPYISTDMNLNDQFFSVDGVIYTKEIVYKEPSAQKVDYRKFLGSLKEKMKEIPNDKRVHFVRSVLYSAVDLWYGYGDGYANNFAIEIENQKKVLLDKMLMIILECLEPGKEGHLEELSEIEETFLKILKYEYNICLEELEMRGIIRFEDSSSEMAYEMITSIMNDADIDPETKKKKIDELRKINARRYKKDKRMKAFSKLALCGENIPTIGEIAKATKELDLYQGQELGKK